MPKNNPHPRPLYASHAEIPPGKGIFKETVIQIWPGSIPTLWRKVKTGQFPPPIHFIGPVQFGTSIMSAPLWTESGSRTKSQQRKATPKKKTRRISTDAAG